MLRVQISAIATLADQQATINAAMQPGIDALEDLTRLSLKVNRVLDAARAKVVQS